MFTKKCFVLVFFISFQFLLAQQTKIINYSVKDGLPSSEVYYAYQDHKGYMWFCTDAGLAKFDGYHFKVFTTSDGLTDNTIFSVFEDTHARLWLRTFNGRICYVLNDTVFKIDANPLLEKDLSAGIITSIYVDEKDTLWIGKQNFKDQCFYRIAPPYKTADFKKCSFEEDTIVGLCNIKISKGNYIFSEKSRNLNFRSSIVKHKFYDYEKKKVSVIPITQQLKDPISKFVKFGDTLLWANKNSIYKLHNNTLLHYWDFNYHMLGMYVDTYGGAWIGSYMGGVHYYSNKELTKEKNWYLKGYSVGEVFEDSQHGIWLPTLEAGVFYMPFQEYQFYDKTSGLPDDYVTTLCISHKKEMLLGFKNGDYCFIDKNISNNLKPSTFSTSFCINRIKEVDTNIFLIADQNNYIKTNKIRFRDNFFTVNNFKEFCFDDKYIYAIKVNCLLTLDKKTFQVIDTLILNSRINCIKNKGSSLWLGTMNGLYFYENKKLQYLGDKNILLKWRINDLAFTSDSTLAIATKGIGILVYKNNKLISQVTSKEGLLSNLCTHVYIDDENYIWVSTNQGLNKIAVNNRVCSVIKNYTTENGLFSNEINEMKKVGDTIWLATKLGLSFFNTKEKKYVFPLYLGNISVNNKAGISGLSFSLAYNENNISINYNAICFKSLGKIKYRYKLRQEDTLWEYTYNTKLNFPSLSAGHYKFCVQAINIDGLYSDTKIVSFIINKPFWLRWWFIILAVFFFIIIAIFIIYNRYYILLKKEKEKLNLANQMHQLEMKALRAQMNPHFIFNSLNSIQELILNNENDNAYKYLSKFAKLVRNILVSSINDFTYLTEEINMLKLYLEIESLRFENSFTYNIQADNIPNKEDLHIPAMIIQPYVENALWHGLMHKTGERILEIEFKVHEKFIVCTVEDNGIGRKKSKEIKQQRENLAKSFGMQITKERLEIINKKYNNDTAVSINIIDKINNEGIYFGTKVELTIPYFIKK